MAGEQGNLIRGAHGRLRNHGDTRRQKFRPKGYPAKNGSQVSCAVLHSFAFLRYVSENQFWSISYLESRSDDIFRIVPSEWMCTHHPLRLHTYITWSHLY